VGLPTTITTWVPWVILLLVILALLRLFVLKATPAAKSSEISTVKYRYRQRKKLCKDNEAAFLLILEKAAGGSVRVFSKVHAAHLLIPRMELSIENWNLSFDRIVAKQFDYVLCSTTDMSILCIVMLYTQKNKKPSTDKFLLKACRSAEIPVVKFSSEEDYTAAECRYLLKKAIPDAFARYSKSKAPVRIDTENIKQKNSEDSLQLMLLREGQRRAQKLQRIKNKKTKSN
jgi:hypothetical protein